MIVLTGGGTGGHLSSVRTLMEAFQSENVSVVFVGSDHGMDRQWLAGDAGFEALYFLNSRGVVNRTLLGMGVSLWHTGAATLKAWGILNRHQVRAVLSMGAYAAGPASFASVLKRVPLFLHEHNARMGMLHRVLSPFSKAVFSSYSNRSPVRDYPVAPAFFKGRRLRSDIQQVLFLGGSQGSRFINDLALKSAQDLIRKGIKISHQTGKADFERVRERYKQLELEIDCFAFESNLAEKMSASDFAVSRAGAGTTWELAANGLPALFIPYPHAVNDHQYQNARFLVRKELSFVRRENEITHDVLMECLNSDLKQKSAGLMELIQPGGAGEIARYLLNRIG